jgi:hypothetical protein
LHGRGKHRHKCRCRNLLNHRDPGRECELCRCRASHAKFHRCWSRN